MKIVYIADTELPSRRANSVNIAMMCEALGKIAQSVELVIPSFSNSTNVELIRTHYGIDSSFSIRQLYVPKFPGSLYLFALRVVVLFGPRGDVYFYGRSLFSLTLLAIKGCQLGIDLHGAVWTKSWLRRRMLKSICRSKGTKLISFNSQKLKELFTKEFEGDIGSHVSLIACPNGAKIESDVIDFKLQGDSLLPKIGYVGSFLPGRGVELIIELAKKCPQFTFHLAGGTRESLASWVQEAPSNLHCYGHIPFTTTNGFRAACDVLIAPYQLDTRVPSGEVTTDFMSPIKLFEYMASGKPIVCSDLPAVREILDEKNSVLVAANDHLAWKNALVTVLADNDLRAKLGQNAVATFKQKFTWAKRAESVLQTFNSQQPVI